MLRGLIHSIKEAIAQILHNRMMCFVSIASISAMLIIMGVFMTLTVNINNLTENLKSEFDTIEIFLEDYTTKADAQVIARNLGSMQEVSFVEYIDKEQAMEEFRERWGENAYLLDTLSENPLPNSLRITLSGLEGGSLVAEVAETMIGVEDVRYYENEIEKVLTITEAIQRISGIMMAFLVVVSLVVVASTIKLTVMSREDEIKIMMYVGATNWFARGPMLVEGMLLGAISAGIALFATDFTYQSVCAFFGDQAVKLFSGSLVDAGFMFDNLAWMFMAIGITIGSVGSLISVRKFLRV